MRQQFYGAWYKYRDTVPDTTGDTVLTQSGSIDVLSIRISIYHVFFGVVVFLPAFFRNNGSGCSGCFCTKQFFFFLLSLIHMPAAIGFAFNYYL